MELPKLDGLNAIFGSGAFKTEPLKQLIARYVDEDLLHLIAAQHLRGRRLFVVTTNIDAQRTAVWNMGAIAASDHSGRLQLFRDILVASASAPGVFAPTYIEVQSGNTRFLEMHVDGAVTSNVLAVPESILLRKIAPTNAVRPNLYIIVNGKITPDFAMIDDGTLSIVARSFYSTVKANTRSTLIATYLCPPQRLGSAAAQINTLNELEAALLACWEPPPIEQSRPGTQITVLMSFRRNGELFEQPRITFQSGDPSDAERASYRTAVAETLKRCASLPFTEALGNALAGAPLTMRFVDDRERPPD